MLLYIYKTNTKIQYNFAIIFIKDFEITIKFCNFFCLQHAYTRNCLLCIKTYFLKLLTCFDVCIIFFLDSFELKKILRNEVENNYFAKNTYIIFVHGYASRKFHN